ncbi:hypothetical protein [Streptomyces sp. NPDC050560]|uniref:hypothetical protein n=1 Tax=Streptomyces sp. NPDC050560 TaxID=3365630 RepID=UPI0037AF9FDC
MRRDTPNPARPLSHLGALQYGVLSAAELRQHGVTPAQAAARCRGGGPWRQVLPGVYLLHPGPPTGGERLRAALLYAVPAPARRDPSRVPPQPPLGVRPGEAPGGFRGVMVTGLAALALYGPGCGVPAGFLEEGAVDVLVPHTRRLRGTGFVRLLRSPRLPMPVRVGGLPVAPPPRALADALAGPGDPAAARLLLPAAVRGGLCETGPLIRELGEAGLLSRPAVADTVDALLAEGRARAEDLLYRTVRGHGLPEPLWNVGLRLPGGGPGLGGVDAYWPAQAVAVELDTRAAAGPADGGRWAAGARKRDRLERLGIALVRLTPRGLGEYPRQQAQRIGAALRAARGRRPPAYVVVVPR